MRDQIRVLKTREDYDKALGYLGELMGKDLAPDSDEEREFDLLNLVIGNYEAETIAPISVDPVDAILFRMDQQNLKRRHLVPYIGSISKVSEVLNRKRHLSLSMIRRLHEGLGIPAESLIGSSEDDEVNLEEAPTFSYEQFPLKEMQERGYFGSFECGTGELKTYAEDLIRGFSGGLPKFAQTPAFLRANLTQSGQRKMNEYGLIAWRMSVLKFARDLGVHKKPYKPGVLSDEVLRDLAKLSTFKDGPLLAQEALASLGISLVFVRHFKHTYLDGAAMMIEDRPVIGMTLRHNRLDNFWFVLMHELVHVQRHLTSERNFISDDFDDAERRGDVIEKEANDGARDALIPRSQWTNSPAATTYARADAEALASALRIHPAIVAGRVRHETGNWRLLSGLASTLIEWHDKGAIH